MELMPIIGIGVVLSAGLLLVIAAVRESRESSEKKDAHAAPLQCAECIGSDDPSCASACGMPS